MSLFMLNGRVTAQWSNPSWGVKNKIVHVKASTNYWTCSENNETNAWNANIPNQNMNNNNKNNSNVVRAVAALDDEQLTGVIDAYSDCMRHKRSSVECTRYRLLYEEDLITLTREIFSGKYKPSVARIFCVSFPKVREICAANFRDRIVQHWVCLRLEPLFEKRFMRMGNVSFNCRKGYGTAAAVNRVIDDIEEMSDDYTQECFIGRFDYKSFFCSIDCKILKDLLTSFIENEYKGKDKKILIRTAQTIIENRPTDNCIVQGNLKLFDILDDSKSLFHMPEAVGLAIGNLTSQLFANFYMSFIDEYALKVCEENDCKYERFVDDFTIVGCKKSVIMNLYRQIGKKAEELLHIRIHPDKVYIQDVRKGVKFVGTYIKPKRKYIVNRTLGRMITRLYGFEKACENIVTRRASRNDVRLLNKQLMSINAYMGFLCDKNSYAIRRKLFSDLKYFWKVCDVTKDYKVVKVKDKYKLTNKLIVYEKLRIRKAERKSQYLRLWNASDYLELLGKINSNRRDRGISKEGGGKTNS